MPDDPPFKRVDTLWEGFSNEPLDERLYGYLESLLEQTAGNPGKTIVAGKSHVSLQMRPSLTHFQHAASQGLRIWFEA